MIKHFTVVANAFMALALVACTSASLSQTPAHRNSHDVSSQDEKQLARFEKQVDDVRTLLGIPGMSAAVIKDQKLIWAKDSVSQISTNGSRPRRIRSFTSPR